MRRGHRKIFYFTYLESFLKVHPDQDVQLGQRPGYPGGEQVRHGGREGHQLREGQAACRQPRAPVLRDVRQGKYQC